MTGAMGTADVPEPNTAASGSAGKVINVPGCPTNPWWFVLTVVAWLVDCHRISGRPWVALASRRWQRTSTAAAVDIDDGVDRLSRLLNAVSIAAAQRVLPALPDYLERASTLKHPGDAGCLQASRLQGPVDQGAVRTSTAGTASSRTNDTDLANDTVGSAQTSDPATASAAAHCIDGRYIRAWVAPKRAIRMPSYPSWCARKGKEGNDR